MAHPTLLLNKLTSMRSIRVGISSSSKVTTILLHPPILGEATEILGTKEEDTNMQVIKEEDIITLIKVEDMAEPMIHSITTPHTNSLAEELVGIPQTTTNNNNNEDMDIQDRAILVCTLSQGLGIHSLKRTNDEFELMPKFAPPIFDCSHVNILLYSYFSL